MECHQAHLLDMLQLSSCLSRSSNLLVLDLSSWHHTCNCSLLGLALGMSDTNIVIFVPLSCGMSFMEHCGSEIQQRTFTLHHRGLVAGLVMEQNGRDYRKATRRHMTRLWTTVNSLPPGHLQDSYRNLTIQAAKSDVVSKGHDLRVDEDENIDGDAEEDDEKDGINGHVYDGDKKAYSDAKDGTQNENGELFTEFCTTNDLVIGGTIFPHKTIHKTTWTSPDGRTVNQIDHITIGRKWRRSLLDVRAKRGADAASDHHLVIAAIKIKLKAYRDQADRPSRKYNVHSLKESVKTNAFRCELRNRFSALDTLPEETIEEHWHDLRKTWTATCKKVLGKKTRQHKEWLTSDTWDLITERKRLKDLINHTDDQDDKRDLQAQYWDVNRQVKRSARNDKRNFINDLTEEAETAAGQRNMKRLYEITRTLSGKNNKPHQTNIPPAAQLLDISTNPPTKTEIIKAIKSLKSGKAAGPDGIPPEALKADIQTSTDMLHPLLRKIWENESVPQDWKKGHLVKLPKKGDLSSCSNWRGIMLLSIPGKVLTRIILERLKTALDKTLREEQAGFRNDRSCTDHIATMRIIIEQSLEWQTPLYSTFVDFQKAFDSVDREVIWKLMSHYGFPPKFVNIIRQLYEDATCQVIHDGKLTEPFTVRTGVRQGCILSPTIFLMVVDWVMRQATDGKRTGIQWTFSKQLEDLDFADDIALLSHKQQDAQEKLN
nr:hypothetical protein BaRGS_008071 [Batillaria attramentaria]